MSEEWGPWIEHHGDGCQCVGMWVEVEAGDPYTKEVQRKLEIRRVNGRGGWLNSDFPVFYVVIRYRIRKPKGMAVLESILQNLPEGVDA
jgi:hypothetical protein